MKIQSFIPTIIIPLLFLSSGLLAQIVPVRDTLHTNSILASVQSNGAFFQGGASGQFLVPTSTGIAPEMSLIKSAGLWLGGRDAAGNLRLSAQLYNENGKTDFYPGVLIEGVGPYPEFNLIAKVTKDQVDAHKANPGSQIPAIYGWPARGNAYFSNYHGFDLPFQNHYLAGFYDKYYNGLYQPSSGDYPAVELRGCLQNFYVDETLWFPFHDVGPHTQSGGTPMNQEVQAQVFAFDCQEGSPVDRLVFAKYKFLNRDTLRLDSCYFGIFIDFEIGNGGDDFIGCDETHRIIYAYNGDDVDEGGFENSPPVMAVELLRGPLDTLGEEVTKWHFVPVDDANLNSPLEYYNLLTGRHTDGTPFPNNGLMYTGNPLDPAAWSEISEGNTPGERKALASFGPFTLLPGAVNELVLAYAWLRKGTSGSVADNLTILQPTMAAARNVYYNCFELYDGCPANVSTGSPDAGLHLTVSPNPFSDWIMVESGEVPMQSAFLYDATGRLVRAIDAGENISLQLQTGDLPPGFYSLEVRTKDGYSGVFKLVHE